MVPESAVSTPLRHFRSVLLPAPFTPIRPTLCPFAKLSDIDSNCGTPVYDLVSPSHFRTVCAPLFVVDSATGAPTEGKARHVRNGFKRTLRCKEAKLNLNARLEIHTMRKTATLTTRTFISSPTCRSLLKLGTPKSDEGAPAYKQNHFVLASFDHKRLILVLIVFNCFGGSQASILIYFRER